MNLLFLYVFFVLVCSFTAYSQPQTEDYVYDLDPISQFALDLYKEVKNDFKDKNFVMSAISLETVLAMVYLGAEKTTRSQMKKLMKFSDDVTLKNDFKTFTKKLNKPKNITLETANTIFVDRKYSLKAKFKTIMKDIFQSDTVITDFTDATKSAKKINDWVANKTKNQIQNLFPKESLKPNTAMILINALYFKGKWDKKFDREYTKETKFVVNKDESVNVELMSQKDEFNVKDVEELDAKIISLPYDNATMKMYIALPNKKDGLKTLEKKLDRMSSVEVSSLLQMGDIQPLETVVQIPKFKLQTTLHLIPVLQKMGFGEILSDANLGKMMEKGPEKMMIAEVIQKSFMEVNEEGTEAAAATGVKVNTESLGEMTYFICDHPFLFFIKHSDSEMVLFHGRVVNPLL